MGAFLFCTRGSRAVTMGHIPPKGYMKKDIERCPFCSLKTLSYRFIFNFLLVFTVNMIVHNTSYKSTLYK